MQAKLFPGHDFEQLVQGAQPPWQHDEPVRKFGHAGFTFVHRGDHLQLGDAGMADFMAHQKIGDNAGNRTAALEYRVGEGAHNANPAAAKDQPYAAFREFLAERAGVVAVRGRAAIRRTAVNAE